jgi:multimeric flavodoxin WrbA
MMKVVAFNGSPRKNGNTFLLLQMVLDELKKHDIETKLIQLGSEALQGCIACYGCKKNMDQKCVLKNDKMNEYIAEMLKADGIILGSPTYLCNVTSNMKSLLDRAGLVAKVNNDMFKYKVGATVVAVRRCGAAHVFNSLNYFFLISQMFVPGSTYWNMGIGLEPGDVKEDTEGLRTMENLGKNMAWLLKKIKQ